MLAGMGGNEFGGSVHPRDTTHTAPRAVRIYPSLWRKRPSRTLRL